jgi:hypothetical protein
MTSSIYINIDPASVRTALTPLVNIVNVRILDKSWSETETSDPATELLSAKQAKYLDRLMLGEKFVPVDGGYQLGELGLNAALNPEFTLKFIDGTAITNISPVLYIRNMPVFDDPNKWTDHPMITSTSAFTSPLEIYIKFEVWNPSSVDFPSNAAYIGVDQNIEVKLMDYDPISGDDELASAFTNANGVVHFSLASLPLDSGGGNPDLYFKIINPTCAAITEFTLPVEWSTANTGLTSVTFWNSSDGTPGYFPDFGGVQLGNAVTPITYRIGMDYHLRLKYFNITSTAENFTKGIKVELLKESVGFTNILETNFTDQNGEIHNITFNALPESDLLFRIHYNIEDIAINLKTTNVYLDKTSENNQTNYWYTNSDDEPVKLYFEDNRNTSLFDISSSQNNIPLEYIFKNELKRSYSFYFLKIVREIHEFLHYFTNGDWQGREINLRQFHFLDPFNTLPTSFPNGIINYTKNENQWTRSTIVHEYFHQVMWQESNYTNGDIAGQFLYDGFSDFDFYHSPDRITNVNQSLTEGWAYALESVFEPSQQYLKLTQLSPTTTLNPLSLSELNKGLTSEGAYGNTIYNVFWKYVVGTNFNYGQILESSNGDLINKNTWMTSANQSLMSSNFISLIWNPLKNLSSMTSWSNKTTQVFLQSMLSNNVAIEHKLRGEMYRWNLMVEIPILNSLLPASAPSNALITITGDFFINPDNGYAYDNNSDVELLFGGVGLSFNVIDRNTITFIAPSNPSGTIRSVKIANFVRGLFVGSNTLTFTYL